MDHQEFCEIAGQNEILEKVVKNVEGLTLNTAMCREMKARESKADNPVNHRHWREDREGEDVVRPTAREPVSGTGKRGRGGRRGRGGKKDLR